MVLHAEAHVNWIADAITYLDDHGHTAIEATADAVEDWIAELQPSGGRVAVHQGELLVHGGERAW